MIERLRLLIEYYNLTASGFADKIDVPRSSISHLLSGRNKPSLDFVMKVAESFDEVELNWIVYGKGTFPKKNPSEQEPSKTLELKQPEAPTLFSDIKEPNQVKKEISQNRKIEKTAQQPKVIESHQNIPHEVEAKEISNKRISANGKKLKKIVLLYDDGSFEEYNK